MVIKKYHRNRYRSKMSCNRIKYLDTSSTIIEKQNQVIPPTMCSAPWKTLSMSNSLGRLIYFFSLKVLNIAGLDPIKLLNYFSQSRLELSTARTRGLKLSRLAALPYNSCQGGWCKGCGEKLPISRRTFIFLAQVSSFDPIQRPSFTLLPNSVTSGQVVQETVK